MQQSAISSGLRHIADTAALKLAKLALIQKPIAALQVSKYGLSLCDGQVTQARQVPVLSFLPCPGPQLRLTKFGLPGGF